MGWCRADGFLKRKGVFEDAPRPDLILLDLDIPEMDDREVLARIKRDPNLKAIPSIIFTTSDSAGDILLCYKLHANYYLQKPANWDEFDYLATSIDRFWLTKGKFPQKILSKSALTVSAHRGRPDPVTSGELAFLGLQNRLEARPASLT